MSKRNHPLFPEIYVYAFKGHVHTCLSRIRGNSLNTSSMSPEKYCPPWKRPSEIHITNMKNRLFCYISAIVIYLDFQLAKRALWLVDSCSSAPDQIQMYPDWDLRSCCPRPEYNSTWSVHDSMKNDVILSQCSPQLDFWISHLIAERPGDCKL